MAAEPAAIKSTAPTTIAGPRRRGPLVPGGALVAAGPAPSPHRGQAPPAAGSRPLQYGQVTVSLMAFHFSGAAGENPTAPPRTLTTDSATGSETAPVASR